MDNGIEMINNKIIKRIFNILVVLFFATPFLLIFYGQLQYQTIGINMRELLEVNQYFNVIFITSFVTPFIGLYMLRLKEELGQKLSKESFLTHLFTITISFLIMGNITYGLFISILIYFIITKWKIRIKDIYHYYKNKKFKLKEWILPIVILVVAIGIRYMFILVENG